tara:strand:- start:3865 stop:4104 length:240 start_codon:yes stop_codon:yes gene_type:complete
MRIVKNTSLQGFYISFSTPEGNKDVFLAPKSSIETPDSWSSLIAENLVRRRMATIRYVEDETPIVSEPVISSRFKKRNK